MTDAPQTGIVVCRGCDRVYHRRGLDRGQSARCPICETHLYKGGGADHDAALALVVTALLLLVLANAFPLMTFEIGGRSQTSTILAGAVGLYQEGFASLSILVFLTSIFLPFCYLAGLLYVLLPGRFGISAPLSGLVFLIVDLLPTWVMLEVYVVGAIVAYVKLADFGEIHPQIALVALFLSATTIMAIRSQLDVGALAEELRVARKGSDR